MQWKTEYENNKNQCKTFLGDSGKRYACKKKLQQQQAYHENASRMQFHAFLKQIWSKNKQQLK